MNGRVYDPTIGRFTSADPYIQFPYDTQSYNRYSYVLTNPVNYIDPSGYGIFGEIKKGFKELERGVSKAWKEVTRASKDLVGGMLIVTGLAVMVIAPEFAWVGASLVASGSAIVNGEERVQLQYRTSYGSSAPRTPSVDSYLASNGAYYDADITYNHKNMNGGATDSFEAALSSLATQNHDSDNFYGEKIIITKNLSVYTPIDYSSLHPDIRYALWAQKDSPIENAVLPVFPIGGGMKVVNSGGLNLFKWTHPTSTKEIAWKNGDYFLFLPNKGNYKLNWRQNASALRSEMKKGNPIYDSYLDSSGYQIVDNYQSFIHAERYLLESRGWRFDKATGAYNPPTSFFPLK